MTTFETPLKRTIRQIVARDMAPIRSLRLLVDSGKLKPFHQTIVAEHYGLTPSSNVMGVLRELAAELDCENDPVESTHP